MNFQAVVLACFPSKDLYPIVSDNVPKILLPVATRPLIFYTLKLFEDCNFESILLVVNGEESGSLVSDWLEENFQNKLRVEVVILDENTGSAEALRLISHRLTAQDIIVINADTITDISLSSLCSQHQIQNSFFSILLNKTFSSNSDKNVSLSKENDKKKLNSSVFGLDESKKRLLFYADGSVSNKNVLIQRSLLRCTGQMTLSCDYIDSQIYIFNRMILKEVLEKNKNIYSIKNELIPFLVDSQLPGSFLQNLKNSVSFLKHSPSAAEFALSQKKFQVEIEKVTERMKKENVLEKVNSVEKKEGEEGGGGRREWESSLYQTSRNVSDALWKCCVQIVSENNFCCILQNLQSYADVNQKICSEFMHLTDFELSPANNVVHERTELGQKTTIGPQCIVGEGTKAKEKCSVKKSIIGKHCTIGSNVKITNSVIMDHVIIDDFCLIQNSIISNNVHLKDHASLKECYVGNEFVVGSNMEFKNESLAK